VLLGRSLATEPRVIVLNDPLRGVDANTKRELYEVFRSLAAEGLSIVLLSTEVRELLTLCDRIGVFHEGALEAVLDGESATDTAVVTAMFGHRAQSGAA
jgi:ribose transport system ATP-binding protein